MWSSGFGIGPGMWLVMGLGTLAFWILVAVAVRALFPKRSGSPVQARPDPLTLLAERLAGGDISVAEYERRRRLIVDGH